jgi:hypothetical protein
MGRDIEQDDKMSVETKSASDKTPLFMKIQIPRTYFVHYHYIYFLSKMVCILQYKHS